LHGITVTRAHGNVHISGHLDTTCPQIRTDIQFFFESLINIYKCPMESDFTDVVIAYFCK